VSSLKGSFKLIIAKDVIIMMGCCKHLAPNKCQTVLLTCV